MAIHYPWLCNVSLLGVCWSPSLPLWLLPGWGGDWSAHQVCRRLSSSSPYPIPNTHTLLPNRGVMEGGFAKRWQEALQDMTGCRCLLDINLAPCFLGSPEMTAASFLKYFSPLYDFLEQENEKAGACIGIASSYFSLKSFSHQKHWQLSEYCSHISIVHPMQAGERTARRRLGNTSRSTGRRCWVCWRPRCRLTGSTTPASASRHRYSHLSKQGGNLPTLCMAKLLSCFSLQRGVECTPDYRAPCYTTLHCTVNLHRLHSELFNF